MPPQNKPKPSEIDRLVAEYSDRRLDEEADRQGVPRDFVRRIAGAESAGRPDVINGTTRSRAGAIGKMQLMPGTAKDLGVDPEDLDGNIRGGVQYAGEMLKRFQGDRAKAAAAYNAGPGAVQKYGGVPPYAETQNYVKKVAGEGEESEIDRLVKEFQQRQQAPAPSPAPEMAPIRPVQPKPVMRNPQRGPLVTPLQRQVQQAQANPFSFTQPTGFEAQAAQAQQRTAQISPDVAARADAAGREFGKYQQKGALGKIGYDLKTGYQGAANTLADQVYNLGEVATGVMTNDLRPLKEQAEGAGRGLLKIASGLTPGGGAMRARQDQAIAALQQRQQARRANDPYWAGSRETQQNVEARKAVNPSLPAQTVRGGAEAAIGTLPIIAASAAGGGLPAVMGITAAQQDYTRPDDAAANLAGAYLSTKAGQAISPAAATLAQRFGGPAKLPTVPQEAIRRGIEGAAGGLTNAAQYAGTQLATGRPIDTQEAIVQGLTGGVMGTAMAPGRRATGEMLARDAAIRDVQAETPGVMTRLNDLGTDARGNITGGRSPIRPDAPQQTQITKIPTGADYARLTAEPAAPKADTPAAPKAEAPAQAQGPGGLRFVQEGERFGLTEKKKNVKWIDFENEDGTRTAKRVYVPDGMTPSQAKRLLTSKPKAEAPQMGTDTGAKPLTYPDEARPVKENPRGRTIQAARDIEMQSRAEADAALQEGRFDDARRALISRLDALRQQKNNVAVKTPGAAKVHAELGRKIFDAQEEIKAIKAQARQTPGRAPRPQQPAAPQARPVQADAPTRDWTAPLAADTPQTARLGGQEAPPAPEMPRAAQPATSGRERIQYRTQDGPQSIELDADLAAQWREMDREAASVRDREEIRNRQDYSPIINQGYERTQKRREIAEIQRDRDARRGVDLMKKTEVDSRDNRVIRLNDDLAREWRREKARIYQGETSLPQGKLKQWADIRNSIERRQADRDAQSGWKEAPIAEGRERIRYSEGKEKRAREVDLDADLAARWREADAEARRNRSVQGGFARKKQREAILAEQARRDAQPATPPAEAPRPRPATGPVEDPTNRLREADYPGGELRPTAGLRVQGQDAEIPAERMQENTNRLRGAEYAGGEVRRGATGPVEGVPVEMPTRRGKAPAPERPAGRFRPGTVENRFGPSTMSAAFPSARRGLRFEGENVAKRIGAGEERGEYGKLASYVFKSTSGKIEQGGAHGQDSFLHDPDTKGALGLTRDAEMQEVSAALKADLTRLFGVESGDVSRTYFSPETLMRWADVRGLGQGAREKLRVAIEKYQRGVLDNDTPPPADTPDRSQPQPVPSDRERPAKAPSDFQRFRESNAKVIASLESISAAEAATPPGKRKFDAAANRLRKSAEQMGVDPSHADAIITDAMNAQMASARRADAGSLKGNAIPPKAEMHRDVLSVTPESLPDLWRDVTDEIAKSDPKLSPKRAGEIAASRIAREIGEKLSEIESATRKRALTPEEEAFYNRINVDEWRINADLADLSGSRTFSADMDHPLAQRPLSAERLTDRLSEQASQGEALRQSAEGADNRRAQEKENRAKRAAEAQENRAREARKASARQAEESAWWQKNAPSLLRSVGRISPAEWRRAAEQSVQRAVDQGVAVPAGILEQYGPKDEAPRPTEATPAQEAPQEAAARKAAAPGEDAATRAYNAGYMFIASSDGKGYWKLRQGFQGRKRSFTTREVSELTGLPEKELQVYADADQEKFFPSPKPTDEDISLVGRRVESTEDGAGVIKSVEAGGRAAIVEFTDKSGTYELPYSMSELRLLDEAPKAPDAPPAAETRPRAVSEAEAAPIATGDAGKAAPKAKRAAKAKPAKPAPPAAPIEDFGEVRKGRNFYAITLHGRENPHHVASKSASGSRTQKRDRRERTFSTESGARRFLEKLYRQAQREGTLPKRETLPEYGEVLVYPPDPQSANMRMIKTADGRRFYIETEESRKAKQGQPSIDIEQIKRNMEAERAKQATPEPKPAPPAAPEPAAAKPAPRGQERMQKFDPRKHIKLIADKPKDIRGSDVWRLFDQADEKDHQAIADYLTRVRPDLSSAVAEARMPTPAEPAAETAKPAGRIDGKDVTADEMAVYDALAKVEPRIGEGAAASLTQSRREAGLSKEAFDRAALSLADKQILALHATDFPQSLSPEGRAALVQGKSEEYIAAALRTPGAKVERAGAAETVKPTAAEARTPALPGLEQLRESYERDAVRRKDFDNWSVREKEGVLPPEESRRRAQVIAEGRHQIVEPTAQEDSDVTAKSRTQKEKPNIGLTPAQVAYLQGKVGEVRPRLDSDGSRAVTIRVPDDGQFTVRTPSEANKLLERLGKPIVSTKRPVKVAQSPADAKIPTDLNENLDIEGAFPVDRVEAMRWGGNHTSSKTWATDGHLAIRLESTSPKQRETLLKPPKIDNRRAPNAEGVESLIARETRNLTGEKGQTAQLADRAIILRNDKNQYAIIEGKRGNPAIVDAQKLRLIQDSVSYDEIRIASEAPGSHPVGFFKAGELQALLMPMRIKGEEAASIIRIAMGEPEAPPAKAKPARKPRVKGSVGKLDREESGGTVLGSDLGSLQSLFDRKRPIPQGRDLDAWQDSIANAIPQDMPEDAISRLDAIVNRAMDAAEAGDRAGWERFRQEAEAIAPPVRKRDVTGRDYVASPLSNLNFKGSYERLAGETGREVSERFRTAQVAIAQGESREAVLRELRRDMHSYKQRLRDENLPGLANMIDDHLRGLQDPDEAFRGITGKIRGFHYNMKLRWNPRSIGVNALQSFQTLWPHMTTAEYTRAIRKAFDPETVERVKEIADRESGGQIEEIDRKKRLPDAFAWVSERNRIIGHVAGEMMADRLGLTGAEKNRMAADWAKKVEFDNSRWDVPPLFRGKIASIVGQFKPFTIKNLERLKADWESAPIPELATNTWKGSGTLARRSKMIVSQLAIGGVRSMLLPGFKSITGVLILGGLAKALQKAGLEDEQAEKAAEAIYFGAPALLQQDLSGSVAFLDEPFGRTASEQLVNFFGGPTLSLGAKIWEEGKAMAEAEDSPRGKSASEKRKDAALRLAKAVTPYTKTAITAYNAAKGRKPTINLGREKTELTMPETIGYGLMGAPVRQTKYYENEEAYDWQKRLLGTEKKNKAIAPAKRPAMPRPRVRKFGET